MSLGGIDDAREFLDGLAQRGIPLDRSLPYRICLAGEVYIRIAGVAVQNARLFIVKVDKLLWSLTVLKNLLIRADDLRVLFQPLTDPSSKVDDLLDAFRG